MIISTSIGLNIILSNRRIENGRTYSHLVTLEQAEQFAADLEAALSSEYSLMKLSKRYGDARLEIACERILAFSSTPSIRNLSSMLRNGQDRVTPAKEQPAAESSGFGITRGAAYFPKGGAELESVGTIAFWEKYTLSVEEAALYFRIGENKLRRLISENEDAEYILWNGNRPQIKRKKFESLIDKLNTI